MSDVFGEPCPCGSAPGGPGYHACCGPLHHGERHADTAEQLMRSRYTAYVHGDTDYLFRTWHPRTRPADVTADADVEWKRLDIIDCTGGGPDDDYGEVEFAAYFDDSKMLERSRFERRSGRWVYLDDVPTQ